MYFLKFVKWCWTKHLTDRERANYVIGGWAGSFFASLALSLIFMTTIPVITWAVIFFGMLISVFTYNRVKRIRDLYLLWESQVFNKLRGK